MKLSIVATLYQSAPYINEFHERESASANSWLVMITRLYL